MREIEVFVYGTLRRGGVREMERLFPGAVFLGAGRVRGRLYDLGEYPGLVLDERAGEVAGDVYGVTARLLAALDEVEDYRADDPAAGLYVRKRADVAVEGGGTRRCWLYEWNGREATRRAVIASGDWIAHVCAAREPRNRLA